MKTSARPALRTTLGRVAVAGVATLASVTAGAPSASAADELAPESTEVPASTETAAPEPTAEVEPAPAEAEPTPVPEKVEEAPEKPADEPAEDETGEGSTPQPETLPPSPSATEKAAQDEKVEAAAEEAEYGTQSFTLTVTRAEGQFFPEYYPENESVHTNGYVYRGSEFVRYIFCNTQVGFSDDTPSSSACTDGEGNSTFELAPGERVELEIGGSRTPGQKVTIEPCLVDECSSTPKDVPYLVEGPTPGVSDSSYPTRTVQGETITVDLLETEWIGDPNTTVRIVSGPAHGTATLGEDGRTLTYTSVEDYAGKDSVTYEVTNTNGSTTATWAFEVRDPLVPIFGSQKYRIGVQVESGAFVPEGTTTAGSTFKIVTTSADGTERTATCTTTSAGFGGVPNPGSGSSCFDESFGTTARAGERVVITQTGAPEGQALVPDPKPFVIEPCDSDVPEACGFKSANFTMKGSILPETQPDTATADQGGEPVDADVLANDDSEDPDTTLSVTPLPAGQGTIEVIGEGVPAPTEPPVVEDRLSAQAVPSAGSLALRYTPDANFSGTIPVEYTVSNSNGSTTETLTVTVRPAAVDPVDPTDPTDPTDPEDEPATDEPATDEPTDEASGEERSDENKVIAKAGSSNATLPDAGGPNLSLLGLGALLAAAGSAVVARSRRRPALTRER